MIRGSVQMSHASLSATWITHEGAHAHPFASDAEGSAQKGWACVLSMRKGRRTTMHLTRVLLCIPYWIGRMWPFGRRKISETHKISAFQMLLFRISMIAKVPDSSRGSTLFRSNSRKPETWSTTRKTPERTARPNKSFGHLSDCVLSVRNYLTHLVKSRRHCQITDKPQYNVVERKNPRVLFVASSDKSTNYSRN